MKKFAFYFSRSVDMSNKHKGQMMGKPIRNFIVFNFTALAAGAAHF